MLQPPVIETAIHLLGVLRDAEEVAAASQGDDKEEFVAFDDTYVMYAYLVGFHISGALHVMSSEFSGLCRSDFFKCLNCRLVLL